MKTLDAYLRSKVGKVYTSIDTEQYRAPLPIYRKAARKRSSTLTPKQFASAYKNELAKDLKSHAKLKFDEDGKGKEYILWNEHVVVEAVLAGIKYQKEEG